jgi:H+/Cl- antiporter ClcA
MIYVKSFLVGVAALIVAVLIVGVFSLASPIVFLMRHQAEGGVGVYENSPWVPLWLIPIGAALIFATAFYCAFRRIKARPSASSQPQSPTPNP